MKYAELGRTKLRISRVGFGGWAIGGGSSEGDFFEGYGKVDDETSEKTLERALELGVNFIDTADFYGNGHSEEIIGRVLKRCRGTVYVTTKVGNQWRDSKPPLKNFTPAYIKSACEKSLSRLQRDVIDLYQLHNPPQLVMDNDEVFEVLQKLKKSGKIRFFGVSITAPEEGLQLIRENRVDTLQIHYNILQREAEEKLFPLARKENIGIIVRTPLLSGLLTGKFDETTTFLANDWRRYCFKGKKLREGVHLVESLRPIAEERDISMAELALRFILSNRAVCAAIPGAKKARQVETNCSAAEESLSDQDLRRIKQLCPGRFETPV